MGLKYRIALGLALRPYWMGLLFTHDNGDFGAVPATERLTHTAPILSVDRHISGSFFCVIPRVFILYRPIAFHTDTQNYPVSVIEFKAPFTGPKIFGTARMKKVRVPKKLVRHG